MKPSARIVLVHGLWNRGWSMTVMARRLRSKGHKVEVFSYPTRSNCLDGHADALHEYLGKVEAETLHLVGHSMGGLVILNMLSRYDDLPPGRVVLMGTPVKGSRVVKRLEKLPGQKLLFGKARENLLQGFEHTPRGHETGMIRGTRALGLGQITGPQGEPNDGTVAVSETELEGLKDTVEMDVSHTEMLVSAEVVEQAEHFLLHGEFCAKQQATPTTR
ncbi:MAG: alpha/beta hydrolase [Xanthomonadales bacterium]|nr:alpha/beta hydrolase [Xanthomonadales bacterium]